MRCAGSRTYPKLPKKWSPEIEANGLSCEALRENFSQNSTLVICFFAFQTIISRFHKRFVEFVKGSLRQIMW